MRVVYTGSVPDAFREGRAILIDGSLRGGLFVAEPGSLSTKCPSKYEAARRRRRRRDLTWSSSAAAA